MDAEKRRSRNTHARARGEAPDKTGVRSAALSGKFRFSETGGKRPWQTRVCVTQKRSAGPPFRHAYASRCNSDLDRNAVRNVRAIQTPLGSGPASVGLQRAAPVRK